MSNSAIKVARAMNLNAQYKKIIKEQKKKQQDEMWAANIHDAVRQVRHSNRVTFTSLRKLGTIPAVVRDEPLPKDKKNKRPWWKKVRDNNFEQGVFHRPLTHPSSMAVWGPDHLLENWILAATPAELDMLLTLLDVPIEMFVRYRRYRTVLYKRVIPVKELSIVDGRKLEQAANLIRSMRSDWEQWKLPRISRYNLKLPECSTCDLAKVQCEAYRAMDTKDANNISRKMSLKMEAAMDDLKYFEEYKPVRRTRSKNR